MTVAITGGTKPRNATPRAGRFSQRQTGMGMANPSMLMRKSKKAYCVCELSEKKREYMTVRLVTDIS